MRAWLVIAALALASCSYGFGDLHPYYEDASTPADAPPSSDPRTRLDPSWTCNPVSDLGCSAGSTYCLGDIESNVRVTNLLCRGGFGSGSYGTFCADLSFCVAGFLCWTDPAVPGATDGTCAEPCFDSTDCTPGYRCETESSYRASFAGATLFRCVPTGT
jgi:hypothetical protein